MKQYKLTGWPDLPSRYQKTAMRRVMSELSQRFVSVRDLARSSGAPVREIDGLIATLNKGGLLMSRDAPQSVHSSQSWREWWPVAAAINAVRSFR